MARAVLLGERAGRLHSDDDPRGRVDLPETRAADLHPLRVVSRDGGMGARAQRIKALHASAEQAWRRAFGPGGRAALAELPREIPRVERPSEADAHRERGAR